MNIHLIASGPSFSLFQKKKTKFDDLIWVNAPWLMRTKVDFCPHCWFEMHTKEQMACESGDWLKWRGTERIIKVDDYWNDALPESDTFVYMQKKYFEIPLSVEYPLPFVLEKFGRIFTSSASYMLALAILLKPVKIFTWGIHMNSTGEYKFQRKAYQKLLFIAQEKGIELVLNTEDIWPEDAKIEELQYIYGYDWKNFIKE